MRKGLPTGLIYLLADYAEEKWLEWRKIVSEHPNAFVVVKVGQTAPDFALPNTDGAVYRLSQATAVQPVILVFYRGDW